MSHPCAILNVVDVKLHGDVEAVKEIPTKDQSVFWGVHSMNPSYNTYNTASGEGVSAQTTD